MEEVIASLVLVLCLAHSLFPSNIGIKSVLEVKALIPVYSSIVSSFDRKGK